MAMKPYVGTLEDTHFADCKASLIDAICNWRASNRYTYFDTKYRGGRIYYYRYVKKNVCSEELVP